MTQRQRCTIAQKSKKFQRPSLDPHLRYCLVCRKAKRVSNALNYRRLTRLGTFFSNSFFPHYNFLSVINQCWGNKNRTRWISAIKIGINELLFVYFLHINHIRCSSNIFLVLWPPAVTHRPLYFHWQRAELCSSCRVLSFDPLSFFNLSLFAWL